MKRFLLPTLCLGFALLAPQATAQTFSTIKSFGNLTNVTGQAPEAALVQGPDGTLYGTAAGGPGNVRGTVFRVNTDGTGFTVLKLFTNYLEGASPEGGVILSGSTLYGTTSDGGTNSYGTIFKMSTNGSGFTVLRHLSENEGSRPLMPLTLSGGVLYGASHQGGSDGYGTLFKINTDGTGYALLKNFKTDDGDGYQPVGRLVLSGSALYGTTEEGGTNGSGTVFKVNTDGNNYTVLVHFDSPTSGGAPLGALALSGGMLYGTTESGGPNGYGTIFKVDTNGAGFVQLKAFGDNFDEGVSPNGGLVLSGSSLYGVTYSAGAFGNGTIFTISTNGSGYTVLRDLAQNDGGSPLAELILSGSTLFGTAYYYGAYGCGTVFKINTDGNSFAVLKSFEPSTEEGWGIYGGVVLSGNTLFGTATYGGDEQMGVIYQIGTDGSGFSKLRNFPTLIGSANADGGHPVGSLVLSGSTLYGAAGDGGSFGKGTLYKLDTSGGNFTVLKSFSGYVDGTNTTGANPSAGLVLSGSTLFGCTWYGGVPDNGTLFKVDTNGGNFTVLKSFSPLINFLTNSDGAYPQSALVPGGSTLYGTAQSGGNATGDGTVFGVSTNGSNFTVLKEFSQFPDDGKLPLGGLLLSGSTLYGTTYQGGSGFVGTVFKVETNGTGYVQLKDFAGSPFDGANPFSKMALSGTTLYGTTQFGGSNGMGTVFKIGTDGGDYTILKQFSGPDGSRPAGDLIVSGNVVYGTTSDGGTLGFGTIFKIDLATTPAPQLAISRSNSSVIVSWPWPSTGFVLQENPTITTTNWLGVTNSVANDGLINWVTVPAGANTRFYRLKK